MKVILALLLGGLIVAVVDLALADGAEDFVIQHRPGANPGADASFDKRLPPVFPGEEVSDGDKKIKVWSSSGPVPVAEEPEVWNEKEARHPHAEKPAPGAVGVIVDRRK